MPIHPPGQPGYDALRVGADWASAVRGNTIFFDYQSGSLMLTPPVDQPPGSGPVAVATPLSNASRPAVLNARVSAPGFEPLTLDATTCSAVFWSESSVEKFLLPYYASAAGQQALQVLAAIAWAWFEYGSSTPVCALVFQYPTQGMLGALSLWDTIGVVHGVQAEGGPPRLTCTPLLQFLQDGEMPLVSAPPPLVAAQQVTPVPRSNLRTQVDSVQAREVAEYVSGLRGNRVLVDAEATPVRADRPTATVELEVEGMTGWQPLEDLGSGKPNIADSVFWSDGSVEMLLSPYYASLKGTWSPWFLILLLWSWSGAINPAIVDAADLLAQLLEASGRVFGAFARPAAAGGEGGGSSGAWGGTEALGEEQIAYAIVHLPRSEYVDQLGNPVEGILVENRTWLLTRQGRYPLVSPTGSRIPADRLSA
jgi:hypothetical protein